MLTVVHKYPKKELDEIRREYDKIPHCYHHYGLGNEVQCQWCKRMTGKRVNYKCGLPRDHEGTHFYLLMWDEKDGMNVWTGAEDSRIKY